MYIFRGQDPEVRTCTLHCVHVYVHVFRVCGLSVCSELVSCTETESTGINIDSCLFCVPPLGFIYNLGVAIYTCTHADRDAYSAATNLN